MRGKKYFVYTQSPQNESLFEPRKLYGRNAYDLLYRYTIIILVLVFTQIGNAQTVKATVKVTRVYGTYDAKNENEDYRFRIWLNQTEAPTCVAVNNINYNTWITTSFFAFSNYSASLQDDLTLEVEAWEEDGCSDCLFTAGSTCGDDGHRSRGSGMIVQAPSGVPTGGASFKLYDLAPGNASTNLIMINYSGSYWVEFLVTYTMPTPSVPTVAISTFEPGVNSKPSDNPVVTLTANPNIKPVFNSMVTYTYYYNLNGDTKTISVVNNNSCAGAPECAGVVDPDVNPPIVYIPACCDLPPFIDETVTDWRLLGSGNQSNPFSINLRDIPDLCSSVSSGTVNFYVITYANGSTSSNSPSTAQGYDKPKIQVSATGNQCQDTPVVLTVPVKSGYSSYGWEYQVSGGPPVALTSTTANSTSVNGLDLPLGQQIFFRAKDSNCYSDYEGPVIFYPPAPQIATYDPVSPVCPDGLGKLTINHQSITPGESFIYSVTQWIPCASGGEIFPDGKMYCSSYIANFINDTGDLTFELEDTKKLGSNPQFAFKPGWYTVVIESKTLIDNRSKNPPLNPPFTLSCPTKIPYQMLITVPATPEIPLPAVTPPSCSGGNDGSAKFHIAKRGKYDSGNDIKYMLKKAGQVYYDTLFVNLDSNNEFTIDSLVTDANYQLIVWDVCTSNPMTQTFGVGVGAAFGVSTSINNPTCLTDINLDGITEGDGSITATATSVPGKYSFYLYSSGDLNTPLGINPSIDANNPNIATFSGLAPSDYKVKVSTNNNCLASYPASPPYITLDAPPTLSADTSVTNATCSNSADGKITLTGITKTSGSIDYSYLLKDDLNATLASGSSTSTSDLLIYSNLSVARTYSLIVKDQCKNDAMVINTTGLTISRPAPININGPGDIKIACFDGSTIATITVQNGTDDYILDIKKDGNSMSGYPKLPQPVRSFDLNIGLGSYSVVATENCNIVGVPNYSTALNFSVLSNATSAITAMITPTDLSCNGDHSGKIEVLVSGGYPGIDNDGLRNYDIKLFRIDTNTEVITEIAECNPGSENCVVFKGLDENIGYQVRVTDQNPSGSCTKIFEGAGEIKTLTSPGPLMVLPIVNSDFSGHKEYGGNIYEQCKGDANVTLNSKVSGGTGPYTFYLSKEGTNPWPLPYDVVTNVVTLNTDFSNLGAGYYRVDVGDARGCDSTSQTFEIKEAATPVQVESISAHVYDNNANTTCYGDSDGSITVKVSGGVGEYIYSLSGDGVVVGKVTKLLDSAVFSGLPAIKANGDTILYTIGLKDTLGCVWQGGTPVSEEFKLIPPAELKFYHSVESKTFPNYEIPCKGDKATVRFTSEGGMLPHYVTINGETRAITSTSPYVEFELIAGTYTADFSDALGCTAPGKVFELREPASHIAISIGAIVPPVCIGGDDGQINVSATGGIESIAGEEYTFQLKKSGAAAYDNDSLKGTGVMFLRPANDFVNQDYSAIGIDAHGCTSETDFTMPVNPTPLTLNTTALVPPSCYGGTDGYITLQSTNHTYMSGGQLKFKLSGGYLGNTITEVLATGNTYTFTNLEGTNEYAPFRAWVEDANACVDTAYQYLPALDLLSPEPLKLDLLKSIRPSCYNGSDGSLYIQVSGGVVPYQYSRDNITYYPATDKIFNNQLTAGQYTFYLKDANYVPDQPTCLNTTQFEVPPGRALRLETAVTNISCKGGSDGSIDLTVSLDNRDTDEIFNLNRLSLSWVNNTISSLPFSTAEDISSLAHGTYTVQASYNVDSLVCTQQKTVSVLEPSSVFRITEVKTYDASCGGYADGKAVVTWAGGWTNSISYYKLDNGAWQPMSSSSFVLTGLAVGSHQVAIAQKNYECTDSKIFEITSSPLALTVGEIFKPSCPQLSDGAVVLSSSGSGVEYAFENDTFQLLSSFTGLAAGTYRFVARKANDPACSSATVEAVITDPDDCGNGPLALTILSTSVATCNASSDGNAQVLANGGVPPYRYYWDGNSTEGTTIATNLAVGGHTVTVKDAMDITKTVSFVITAYAALSAEPFTTLTSCAITCDGTVQLLVTGGSGQYIITWTDGLTGDTRTDLCVGTYTYTITDAADNANTCSITGTVTIDHYPSLTLSEQNAVAPICPGGTDGYVSVEADGGSGQYQLQWANQNNGTGKVTTLSGVAPGAYSLTVTDNVLGCTLSANFAIPDALPITVTSTDITPPSCNGGTNGRIALTLSNAISPLVQWSDGQLGLQAMNLKAGTYQYSITSALGCSITGSATVTDRPELQVSSATVVPTCFGLCDGEVSLSVTGGTTPYAITWAHGPKTLTAKSLCAGTYSYTVSDKFGCTINSSVEITAPDPVTITLLSKEDVSCNDGTDGALEASATGGTGTLTYLWNTGAETPTLSDVGAGSYTLSVSDDNACTAHKTYSITEPALLLFKDEKIINPSCPASTDGQIATSGTGGTAPYQYQWTDQINGSSRTGLSAGDYTVTVTDSKGCAIIKKYVLSPPAPLEIVNVTKADPSCTSYQDGHISVQAIGGVSPYSFSWANGGEQASITALPAGTYSVTIKDKNNCTITGSYTLTDPMKPVITGIAAKTVICTGSTAAMQPNGEWSRYEWTSPQGKVVATERYETGVLGTHTLTAWDQRNCPAKTSFIIEVSDNALTADFLRLSEPIAFQPVVFVDISEPVPTAVEWLLPADVVVNRMNNEMIEVVFIDSGSYEIGMKATLDRCQSELYKIVEVKEQNNAGANSGGEDEEKLNVIVYPNPAADQLNVQVASDSRNEVVLRLLTSLENRQVAYERLDGQFDYLVRWEVSSLTPGVFFLVYEQNGKIYSKRVLVVR